MDTQARSPSRHEPKRHTAPLSFFNPTRVLFTSEIASSKPSLSGHVPVSTNTANLISHPAVTYKWTSRNNRKGRHAVSIDLSRWTSRDKELTRRPTTSWQTTLRGIWRMFTKFPVWDVSYDVATIFTLGSVVWVFNAFFVWLPLAAPRTEFTNEELYGGGITAFIGATIFEIGSILLMAEAVNENRTACFGWALERALSSDSEKASVDGLHLRPTESHCTHHHKNRRNLVGRAVTMGSMPRPGSKLQPQERSWIWFPSVQELRNHYIRELGFLASLTQLVAASIFWIAGFTALPGIYDHMSRTVTIVLYWTPQVVGGTGFILSGALFMLETQERWYKPAFQTLGWWIGAWNFIGGVGFTLCPAFGYDESSWAQYQACLSTFWASWAFLIGSVLQWYESLEKHPLEVKSTKDKA
ncbi:hypothetical protein BU23DRAFT_90715 [Bimuria novae-zelandiae CBS 107.79]|uniref:Integral membrane protein n=1 Tax=Bimuria novae-zelandiae CBS 107.79 TaxID=1447943 RepID=A0A6A5VC99_9PLEO|nr:hypothetical protein BU23DRAFT_90715 [Bimuria novae-zelandiae CBS 107.79]